MRSRNKKDKKRSTRTITWVVILASLGLALAVGLGFRANSPDAIAEAVSPQQTNGQSNQLPAAWSSDPVLQGAQIQTAKGITVTVANVRREADLLKLDVCFDLPDNDDWTLWNVSLQNGDWTVTDYGTEPIEIRHNSVDGRQSVFTFNEQGQMQERAEPATSGQRGRRCDIVYFWDIPVSADLSPYTFTIESISAQPGEGEECSPAVLEKVNAALAARSPGITARCVLEDLGGGGMSGFAVESHPPSMSRAQAETVLQSLDLFVDVFGIRGPWIFILSLTD